MHCFVSKTLHFWNLQFWAHRRTLYNEFGTSAEQSEFYLVHFRSFFAAIIFLVIIMCTNFPNWVCFHRSQKISALRSHNFTDWTVIFFQTKWMSMLNLQFHLSRNHFVSSLACDQTQSSLTTTLWLVKPDRKPNATLVFQLDFFFFDYTI